MRVDHDDDQSLDSSGTASEPMAVVVPRRAPPRAMGTRRPSTAAAAGGAGAATQQFLSLPGPEAVVTDNERVEILIDEDEEEEEERYVDVDEDEDDEYIHVDEGDVNYDDDDFEEEEEGEEDGESDEEEDIEQCRFNRSLSALKRKRAGSVPMVMKAQRMHGSSSSGGGGGASQQQQQQPLMWHTAQANRTTKWNNLSRTFSFPSSRDNGVLLHIDSSSSFINSGG